MFGGFDRSTPTFSGFQLVVQLLKFPDLKKFNLLLLTYEDNGNLLVGLFDDNFVEVLSSGTPLSNGKNYLILVPSLLLVLFMLLICFLLHMIILNN